MTDISRHALLKQAHEVCQEIEKCGASPQLTNAITKASELLRTLDDFIPVNSGAKPQDGSTVKGYRTLGPKEIDDMNQLKNVSRDFCILLEKQRAWVQDELQMTGNHSAEAHEAGRCLSIARTKMQEACMWACRAVARPDADC